VSRNRHGRPSALSASGRRVEPTGDGRVGRRRRIGPPRKRKKGKGHAGGKEGSFLHSRAGYRPAALLLFASHSSHEEDRSLIRGLNKRTCMTPHTSHNSQVLHISVGHSTPSIPCQTTMMMTPTLVTFATDEEDTAGRCCSCPPTANFRRNARDHHPGSSVHFLNMLQSCR
jgi:hypothetical protein